MYCDFIVDRVDETTRFLGGGGACARTLRREGEIKASAADAAVTVKDNDRLGAAGDDRRRQRRRAAADARQVRRSATYAVDNLQHTSLRTAVNRGVSRGQRGRGAGECPPHWNLKMMTSYAVTL